MTESDQDVIVLDPDDPAFAFPPDADDDTLLGRVLDFYTSTLKRDEDALAYLRNNAISADLIMRFRLGYGDRSLGPSLPKQTTKFGRAIRDRLTSIGIFRDSGHEHLTGSLVMPFLDATGRVLQVYGRKLLGTQLRQGTPLDLYLPRPIPPLWNASAVTTDGKAVITDSILDALALISAGLDHCVAITTADHAAVITALGERGARGLWLAYPRNDAGDAAARALADAVAQVEMTSYRVLLPFGMCARQYGAKSGSDALVAAVRAAELLTTGSGTAPVGSRDPENRPNPPSSEGITPRPASPTPTSIYQPPTEPAPTTAPVPPPPVSNIAVHAEGDDLHAVIGDRRYRLRGVFKNTDGGALRVTCRVGNESGTHVDSIDLYNARNRTAFQNAAGDELGVKAEVVKRDLGRLILAVEQAIAERAKSTEKPVEQKPLMTPEEEAEALALLRDPKLTERIVADFAKCGLVGEELNKLIAYLAAISRKLDDPLAVVVQSSSAAGKTSLMDSVLAFVPPEDLVQFSSMTGQSLFYMAENGLSHRVLAIAEEAGSERVTYSLKLLQSEGELRIASTGKDSQTGKLTTTTYSVAGPVALFLTTTSIDLDEELANRCLILSVDEGRAQTRAVHEAQRTRHTLAGRLAGNARNGLLSLHRNVQRLLKPVLVVNPFAPKLTFPDERTRTRRDHAKYLALIESVAFLHQYQRPKLTAEHEGKTVEYIEATIDDVALATRLAHHALGRSLDELPPQTRRLLNLIAEMVDEKCKAKAIDRADFRFTRREVREQTRWGLTQLRIHMLRLAELELIIAHPVEHGRGRCYELRGDVARDGGTYVPGLLDVATIRNAVGLPANVGALSGEGRGGEIATNHKGTPQIQPLMSGVRPTEEEGLSKGPHRTRRRHRSAGTDS